jgi:hypothetical protein
MNDDDILKNREEITKAVADMFTNQYIYKEYEEPNNENIYYTQAEDRIDALLLYFGNDWPRELLDEDRKLFP